jgi:hypothetical protein
MPIFKYSKPLSTYLVWKIARTPLPFVDRNNRLPKQFLSLFYKWKALAHIKSLLPSVKGSFFFYFYVESLSSILMHQLREHSCHFVYNVHNPKICYWLIHDYGIACSQIICIQSPFELWRCPMHLCFAIPWRTSWIPLCYAFSMLKTNK